MIIQQINPHVTLKTAETAPALGKTYSLKTRNILDSWMM
jgi:hypothetical protein